MYGKMGTYESKRSLSSQALRHILRQPIPVTAPIIATCIFTRQWYYSRATLLS